jgi:signal transduction histidine kinase/ActR/RegA family two-component response regulator
MSGVGLISILPLLVLMFIVSCNLPDGVFITWPQVWIVVSTLVASIMGFSLLQKYPLNMARIRTYLEKMMHGELPEKVVLLKAEEDAAAIEESLNTVLNNMKSLETSVRSEREDLLRQLYESQKMESIGNLSGQVAHEFNNLLMAISGYSELILANAGENTTLRDDVQQILKACDRAGGLVRQLLAFGRRQPLQQKPQSLNTIVSSMTKMIQTLVGEDIRLTTTLAPDLRLASVDAGQIQQVIMNLVSNARDAMPNGGELIIKTENVLLDQHVIKMIPESSQGAFIRLIVEDSGTGINKEALSRIFEPFFTTKKQKGSGLGLSTAHGIVKQHGGWINVYSEQGHGAIFKIYIPASASTTTAESEEKATLAAIPAAIGKGERILLIEDDDEVRGLTKKALSAHGYVVIEASDALMGLQIFEREQDNLDLVFSDVVLPGNMSGVELVEMMLSRKPQLKVLLCSGYTDQKSQWPLIREKHFRFLHKPCPVAELLRSVRTTLDATP